jgi:D-arabinose 1-dehydrogenase-like Zn-dependent alcohol dehydrogenase
MSETMQATMADGAAAARTYAARAYAASSASSGPGAGQHYSPLRHWNVRSGQTVGVVGIGGLGHMAVKLANAFGARDAKHQGRFVIDMASLKS